MLPQQKQVRRKSGMTCKQKRLSRYKITDILIMEMPLPLSPTMKRLAHQSANHVHAETNAKGIQSLHYLLRTLTTSRPLSLPRTQMSSSVTPSHEVPHLFPIIVYTVFHFILSLFSVSFLILITQRLCNLSLGEVPSV